MGVSPESIQVGQCYLMVAGQVRRVLAILPDGRVQYEQRAGHRPRWNVLRSGILGLRSFSSTVERPVPCNWTLKPTSDDPPRPQSPPVL